MNRMEDDKLLDMSDEILVQETQDQNFPATFTENIIGIHQTSRGTEAVNPNNNSPSKECVQMAEFFTVLHNQDCREVTSPSRSHHNCSRNSMYRIYVYVRMCICSMY